MKQTLKLLTIMLLVLVCIFAFIACNGGDTTPKDPNPPGTTTPTDPDNPSNPSNPSNPTNPSDTLPTAAQVAAAIQTQSQSATQNYDFRLELAGNVQIAGVTTPNAHAIYDGYYRYNSTTGELKFKRTTSGALLYDSTEFAQSQEDSILTVKQDEKGKIKGVSVMAKNDFSMINAPFVSLVSSLDANSITGITRSGTDSYTASLKLSAENTVLNLICKALGKMDLNISLKGVEFTNPVNGLGFAFTMSGNAITSYTLTAKVNVPVKNSANIDLDLKYEQRDSSTTVTIPNFDMLTISKTEIASKIAGIASKLAAVRNEDTYSLDVNAVNEMDPAWNISATKDSYQARFYKHTVDNSVDFNNSYEFKLHNETNDKETYQYSIGNIADDTVWKVHHKSLTSREGQQLTEPVTAEDQFDTLTAMFGMTGLDVSCIMSATESETTTYTIYLSDTAVKALSDKIVAFLNTNGEDGVKTVNNFIGSEYTVKDVSFTVVVEGGALKSIEFESQIKYTPSAGDYTDYTVTLDNELTLLVNDKLEAAGKYEAPTKADGPVSHLKHLL